MKSRVTRIGLGLVALVPLLVVVGGLVSALGADGETAAWISFGVGVERTFPVHTPTVAQIERVTRGDVRRAKLYYLRDRVGKKAKVRELRD